jgi:hypothetical protein
MPDSMPPDQLSEPTSAPAPIPADPLRLLINQLAAERGGRGVLPAVVSVSTVQKLFADQNAQFPSLLTYAQAAKLVQVSVSTLKGWFSQGRFAKCVKRGKPARVIRDLFVVEFLRDEFGINLE